QENHSIRLWDVETGQPKRTIALDGDAQAWWVEFSPDGSLLASSGFDVNKSVRLWDHGTGTEAAPLPAVGGRLIRSLAFRPDGKVLAVANGEGQVLFLDPATGKE